MSPFVKYTKSHSRGQLFIKSNSSQTTSESCTQKPSSAINHHLNVFFKNVFTIKEFYTPNCLIDGPTRIQPSSGGQWIEGNLTTINDEPKLLSVKLGCWQLKGWLYVEADIQYPRIATTNKATFDYDIGSGFSALHSVAAIQDPKNKRVMAIIQCTDTLQALRFIPASAPGPFTFTGIKIQKLNKFTALLKSYKNFEASQRALGKTKLDTILSAFKSVFDGRLRHLSTNMHGAQFSTHSQSQKEKYQEWRTKHERPQTSAQLRERVENLSYKPLFSIVIPTYNSPADLLAECIDSVISQSYGKWELCIADDNSTVPEVKALLNHYQENHENIHCVFRKKNGHISMATNSAINIAKGDYIVFLDHDDLLSQHALLRNAEELNLHPETKILYSDEDKIDVQGERFDPHFKPCFNRDLLYSQNYISHLCVYQAELVHAVSGLRTGFEGSQDFDLLLRCIRLVDDNQIRHIPEVLYHWRVIQGSTALSYDQKEYTSTAGQMALEDHFAAIGANVIVTPGQIANTFKTEWLLAEKPLVSLIMPVFNKFHITKKALDSILNLTSWESFEIIVINNNSDEQEILDYFQELQYHSKVSVYHYPHPFNYSAINNFGVQKAKGTVIGLVNNDIEVINTNWLTEMIQQAMRKDIGCVGAKLYYAEQNSKIQHAGVILGVGGVANHAHVLFDKDHPGYFGRLHVTQNVSAVTAAVLLVRKEIYEEVGGLNERQLQVAFNDVDFCLRVIQAGYRNIWTPFAELYHHESLTRGADNLEHSKRFQKEQDYMLQTYGDKLKTDPFYSPNLNHRSANFEIIDH